MRMLRSRRRFPARAAFVWLAAVFLLAAAVSPAAAQQLAPMTVEMAIADYPPLFGEKLPFGGILTRVVTEAYAKSNVTVKLKWVPSNRAIAGPMEGLYDGSYGWAHAPDRDAKLLYSKAVLYNFRMVFFQRTGKDYPWKKLEDLGTSVTFGATIGNAYSDDFTSLQKAGKIKVDSSNDDATGMRKLAAGRIDLFPMEQEAGQMLAAQALPKADRGKITFQTNALWDVPTYVVIRKTHPQAQELLDRFDMGFNALAASGQLKTLMDETRKAIQAQF